jgi:hypothetical protein
MHQHQAYSADFKSFLHLNFASNKRAPFQKFHAPGAFITNNTVLLIHLHHYQKVFILYFGLKRPLM